MNSPTVIAAAFLSGFAVGTVTRRWLAVLRRGAVLRFGWIELPSAVISGLSVLPGPAGPPGPWLVASWIGLLGVPLSAVDIRHHRLPDAITLPAIPATLAVVGLNSWLVPSAGSVVRAVVGGVVLGAAFYLPALLSPSSIGRGDAKLAPSIGLALGYLSWQALPFGMLLAFAIGSIVGLAGLLIGRLKLGSAIAFGPLMLLSCWLTLTVPQLASFG